MANKMNQNNKSNNPFHHYPNKLVLIRQPVNHLSEATSGLELTRSDQIHQEQNKEIRQPVDHLSGATTENELTRSDRIHQEHPKEIGQPVDHLSGATTRQELTQPVKNISVLTGNAFTHSDGIYPKDFDEMQIAESSSGPAHRYQIYPSLFENIRQPVNHLSGATTRQELTQPVKNISVLTGKALTHSDGIYPKDFDEMQIAESSSGPAHRYQIYPSLFENLQRDTLDVARNDCSRVIVEHDLPHSDRIPPTQLEKMFRPGSKFSWSMDEVLMLGDRIYPMQFDQMSKPAYNFSFSIENAMMLGGRYYPLKINVRTEVQCSSVCKSREPIVLDL